MITVLHKLCKNYSYSKESSILPSRDLVESLEGRLLHLVMLEVQLHSE